MNKVPFCYIIDDNEIHHELIKYSIDTLLKYNGEYIDKVIIIDIGMKDDQKRDLIIFFNKLSSNVKLKFYTLDIHKADIFPDMPNATNSRLGKTTLIRFFISELLEEEYVWYCDTDILFYGDIKDELLGFDLHNTLFKSYLRNAEETREYINVIGKLMFQTETTDYIFVDIFNAGFMFINNKMFNDLNCLQLAIDFYKKYANKIKFLNQDTYVYLFRKFFDKCILAYNIKINNWIDARYNVIHFKGCIEDKQRFMKLIYDEISVDNFTRYQPNFDHILKEYEMYKNIVDKNKNVLGLN